MVEIKTEWTKENIDNFVKYSVLGKSPYQKITFIVLIAFFALLFIFCLTLFIISHEFMMLIGSIVLAATAGIFTLIFVLMLKQYAKRLMTLNADSKINAAMIDNEKIVIIENDNPIGKIIWENISEIEQDKKHNAAYIITKESAMMILEYENIIFGSTDELEHIFGEVDGKLSKKA